MGRKELLIHLTSFFTAISAMITGISAYPATFQVGGMLGAFLVACFANGSTKRVQLFAEC
jgi:hypothetical protein